MAARLNVTELKGAWCTSHTICRKRTFRTRLTGILGSTTPRVIIKASDGDGSLSGSVDTYYDAILAKRLRSQEITDSCPNLRS
jgi:hypothetical protein